VIRLWIVVGVVCGVVSGVHAQGQRDGSALIGTWTAPESSARAATLTFLKGGVFEVEFRGDAEVEVAVKDDCEGRVMILERRAALKRTWTKKK
jgi:hypothetical protein